MILAMVKVLPEPVTPSRIWCLLAGGHAGDELFDGAALIAARLVIAD